MFFGIAFAALGLLLGLTNSVGGADPASIGLAIGQVLIGLFLGVIGYRQSKKPDEPGDDLQDVELDASE